MIILQKKFVGTGREHPCMRVTIFSGGRERRGAGGGGRGAINYTRRRSERLMDVLSFPPPLAKERKEEEEKVGKWRHFDCSTVMDAAALCSSFARAQSLLNKITRAGERERKGWEDFEKKKKDDELICKLLKAGGNRGQMWRPCRRNLSEISPIQKSLILPPHPHPR